MAEVLSGPVLDVAPRLLGAVVTHESDHGTVAVRLTEVEAYGGERDPGSHAFSGPTQRNQVMFGPPGRVYVYLSYGVHRCMNVVCGVEGHAAAVLLRAGEVVAGAELARLRRGDARDRDLARGPGRLCAALGVDLSHNGLDLSRSPLTLRLPDPGGTRQVRSTGPRVGLRKAADRPWRFWVTDDPTVSAYRPATKAPR